MKKRLSFAPFDTKNLHFTKAGSGQTRENSKKGSLLFAGELDSLAFLSEVDAASAVIKEHSDCVCGAQQKGVNFLTFFCFS
eukprot:COSAG06_NODE_21283_length_762_cov_11.105581_1_plen_81_part_00